MCNKERIMYILSSSILLATLLFVQSQLLGTNVYAQEVSKNKTISDEKPQIINFEDKAVEKITRLIIDKPKGNITNEDVLNINYFGEYHWGLPSSLQKYEFGEEYYSYLNEVKSLSDLKWFKNLVGICLPYYNNVEDISGIGNLENLEVLILNSSKIKNIEFISNFKNLRILAINEYDMPDLTPLAHLTKLETLILDKNSIKDITPLKGLTDLTSLEMPNNNITDITPLKNLKYLERLNLNNNNIKEIKILKNMLRLNELKLYGNNVSDITPIMDLEFLQFLTIDNNPINESQLEEFYTKKIGISESINVKISNKLPEITVVSKGFTYRTGLYINNIEKIDIVDSENGILLQEIEVKDESDNGNQSSYISFVDANLDGIKDLCIFTYATYGPRESTSYKYYDYYLWDNKSYSFVYNKELNNLYEPYFDYYKNLILVDTSEYNSRERTLWGYEFINSNLIKVAEIKSKTYNVDFELISKVTKLAENYKNANYYGLEHNIVYNIDEKTNKPKFYKEVYEFYAINQDLEKETICELDVMKDKEIINKYIAPFVIKYDTSDSI